MQRCHIFDVFLMRIKCVVKNVIIFDLIFDTNKKKRGNPIFRAVLWDPLAHARVHEKHFEIVGPTFSNTVFICLKSVHLRNAS